MEPKRVSKPRSLLYSQFVKKSKISIEIITVKGTGG